MFGESVVFMMTFRKMSPSVNGIFRFAKFLQDKEVDGGRGAGGEVDRERVVY